MSLLSCQKSNIVNSCGYFRDGPAMCGQGCLKLTGNYFVHTRSDRNNASTAHILSVITYKQIKQRLELSSDKTWNYLKIVTTELWTKQV